MAPSSDNKTKYISPFNIISIIVMIVAILMAIFFYDTLAYKVMAVAIAFMAGIALLSSMVTKKENHVEIGKFNKFNNIKSSNNLITNTTKDEKATHTIIDNFDIDLGEDEAKILKFMSEEEGFMIVNNSSNKVEPIIEKKEYKTDFKVVIPDEKLITNIEEKTINNEIANKELVSDVNNDADDNQMESLFEMPDVADTEKENIIHTDKIIENKYVAAELKKDKLDIDNNISTFTTEKIEIIDKNIWKEEIPTNENAKEYTTTEKDIIEHNKNLDSYKTETIDTQTQYDCVKHPTDIPIEFISDINTEKKMDDTVNGFSYLIKRFLFIIRSVLDVKIIAFAWVNMDNKTITLDSYSNDNDIKDAIITDKIIKFGNDILSQIVTSAKPQILTQIQPVAELDLIPYYNKQTGTSSFIGVPILLDNNVVGILCADTRTANAYDKTTVMFLGHFTKIVAALLSAYAKNYENENASKTLSLINKFIASNEHSDGTFSSICNTIVEFVISLYRGCSAVGIAAFDDNRTQLNVVSYKSIENVNEQFFKLPISLKSSLLGNSVANAKIVAIPNVPNDCIRINNAETQTENISFTSVPIASTSNVYGALFIESFVSDFINNIDFQVLTAICNRAGEFIEKLKIITLFNNYAAIDINTGITTKNAFHKRLNEELQRANNTNTQITLALITIDESQSINNEHKKTILLNNLIKNISEQLEQYEILGKVTNDVLGIIFIGRNIQEVKLLMERIRQHIATQFLNFNNEKFIGTISVGIVASQKNDTFDKLTTNATSALRQAQKRVNSVILFE